MKPETSLKMQNSFQTALSFLIIGRKKKRGCNNDLQYCDIPGEALHSFAHLLALQSFLLSKLRKILMEVHAWQTQTAFSSPSQPLKAKIIFITFANF